MNITKKPSQFDFLELNYLKSIFYQLILSKYSPTPFSKGEKKYKWSIEGKEASKNQNQKFIADFELERLTSRKGIIPFSFSKVCRIGYHF
jgi:hypothetical protein